MKYKEILEPVKDELKEVERRIEDFIKKSPLKSFFKDSYINKGKKVRPSIVLITGKALATEEIDLLIDYAVAVELFHNSTLIHDDIVDESLTRRGEKSFNKKFGNSVSIFLGDYLLLFVNEILVKKKRNDIMEAFLFAAKDVLYGETIEAIENGNLELEEDKYIEIVEKKTASLFSLSFEIPAIISNLESSLKEKLKTIGKSLGIAFQLIDDVLDYKGEEKLIGKPTMNDLKEREITLPLIYAFNEKPEIKDNVKNYFKNPSQEKLLKIKKLIEKTDALKRTKTLAENYIKDAEKLISQIFKNSTYKKHLLQLSQFFSKRSK